MEWVISEISFNVGLSFWPSMVPQPYLLPLHVGISQEDWLRDLKRTLEAIVDVQWELCITGDAVILFR